MTKIEQKPFNLDGQVLVESFDPRLYETAFQWRSVFHVMRQIHHLFICDRALDSDQLPVTSDQLPTNNE